MDVTNPLHKDSLGKSVWNTLHGFSFAYPEKPSRVERKAAKQFVYSIGELFSCQKCKNEFKSILDHYPPNVSNMKQFARWGVEVHNMVNKRLRKPEYDFEKVYQHYLGEPINHLWRKELDAMKYYKHGKKFTDTIIFAVVIILVLGILIFVISKYFVNKKKRTREDQEE